MIEAFVQGLFNYADPLAIGFLMLGVIIGIVIGIIPALGGLTAMSLLLPLVFGMDRVAALSMLVGIHAISATGDAITSILMGIPGSGPATVVMLDGFQMTRKGEPGRALGAMMGADTVGAILGVGLAFLMVPIVREIVLTFGNPELFLLTLMGLSFLAILSRGSPLKGLMAGFTGIIIALIGYQNSTGVDRLAFGNTFLLNGLALIPVVLGLFAGAEMLELAINNETIVPKGLLKIGKELRSQFWVGVWDVWRHKWLWLRSCIMGYAMGLVPGIGNEVAVWITYGQAKQTSRHPELYGKGFIEGVIAPAGLNAKEGSSLLSTLALGLPSGASMAIVLGALLLQGVIPGPSLLKNDLPLVFTLIWGLAIANIIGAVVCYFIVGYLNLTRLVTLPPRYLVPPVLALVFIGAYAEKNRVEDLFIALAFTLIGLLMKKHGYNRAALVLGFILGKYFENYFWLSLQTGGPFFFLRPASLIIMAIIIGLYALGPIRSLFKRQQTGTLAGGTFGGELPL